MRQLLTMNNYDDLHSGATRYYQLSNGNAVACTTEFDAEGIITTDGNISNLYVELENAPGTGKSYTFTMRKNETDTSITTTIQNTSKRGNDTINTITVTAGDRLCLKCVPSGTPAVGKLRVACIYTGNTAKESIILGGTGGRNLGPVWPTRLIQHRASNGLNEYTIIPTAGSIKNFYVELETAPGAGKSRILTIYKNDVATSLEVTIANANKTGNDTTHKINVSPGDKIYILVTNVGGPAASPGTWGTTFLSDIDGESIISQVTYQNPGNTIIQYIATSGDSGWETDVNDVYTIGINNFTLKKLCCYSHFSISEWVPIKGSWELSVYKNGEKTNLRVTYPDLEKGVKINTKDEVHLDDYSNIALTLVRSNRIGISLTPAGKKFILHLGLLNMRNKYADRAWNVEAQIWIGYFSMVCKDDLV